MPQHSYGWKPSPPDFRDLIFSAPPVTMKALPASVDLSIPALPAPFEPALNQNTLGSCGPHSAVADIVFDLLKRYSACVMPSRLFVYYCTRLLMGTVEQDSGVYNRAMLKALAQFGWCDESLWEYDISRFKEKPPQSCFEQAAQRKISEYLSVPQTIEQMKGCLANGDPWIAGFTVYSSFETPQVEQTGLVPMPSTRDSALGGHDVLIVGYDDRTQRFKFKNSWGSGWGQNGYGWLPYSYLTNSRLASDFWTVVHAKVPEPTPPPPPPPPSGEVDIRLTLDGVSYAGSVKKM